MHLEPSDFDGYSLELYYAVLCYISFRYNRSSPHEFKELCILQLGSYQLPSEVISRLSLVCCDSTLHVPDGLKCNSCRKENCSVEHSFLS